MRAWLVACLLAIASVAQAEVFYGIEYMDTLADVKRKYPGAVFSRVRPAWLQPDQACVEMSGSGVSNKIVIIFEDIRPFFLSRLNYGGDNPYENNLKKLLGQSDDDALTVAEVRLLYSPPIKIESFKRRYGPNTCRETEDFRKLCDFPGRAITALLTPDEKSVFMALSWFTDKERAQILQRKEMAAREKLRREIPAIESPEAAPPPAFK